MKCPKCGAEKESGDGFIFGAFALVCFLLGLVTFPLGTGLWVFALLFLIISSASSNCPRCGK